MFLLTWCDEHATRARSVQVIGTFTDWEARPLDLKRAQQACGNLSVSQGRVVFYVALQLPPGRQMFKFLVDGELRLDPNTPTEDDGKGGLQHFLDVDESENFDADDSKETLVQSQKSVKVQKHEPVSAAPAEVLKPRVKFAVSSSTQAQETEIELLQTSAALNKSPGSPVQILKPKTQGQEPFPGTILELSPEVLEPADVDFPPEVFEDLGPVFEVSMSEMSLNKLKASHKIGSLDQISSWALSLAEKFDHSRTELEFGIDNSAIPERSTRLYRSYSECEGLKMSKQQSNEHEILRMQRNFETPSEHDLVNPMLLSAQKREGKLLIALVGLPARGKSYISRTLERHFNWSGINTETFNCGDYRRKNIGVHLPSTFYDPENPEGLQARQEIAQHCLSDCLTVLATTNLCIGIFDATNSTTARRKWISEQVAKAPIKIGLVFIESVCNDDLIIEKNINCSKLVNQEYLGVDRKQAVVDFQERVDFYKKQYQTLHPEEGHSYIKNIDIGQQLICNKIGGFVASRIMLMVANMHIMPRKIWLSRHGQSEYNVQGRIGGNSGLSHLGQLYADHLTEFFKERYPEPNDEGFAVWTSTMRRTAMTTRKMLNVWDVIKWRALDEIDAGVMDGMTYQAFAEQMPEDYRARKSDKLSYRYPRGESYKDLFARVEPVLFEMMRQTTPLLIVGHQAVLRIIYGYLTGKRPEECPVLQMPLHTIIELRPLPSGNGCEELWHNIMKTEQTPTVVSMAPRRGSSILMDGDM